MKPEDRREADSFPESADVASATECTGLMPALPPDDAANADSAALYAIHNAKGAREELYKK
ncbi:MAG: hypothetical protein IJ769_13255 [Clostridia bacterium]|nr:hypothetical protein [Clostridia bacterium]